MVQPGILVFSIVFSVGLGVLLHLLFTAVLQSGWSGWLV